jgi:hypothetical protein
MTIRKTVTPAVVAANRDNAKKSFGPRTAQGKSRSRDNAVKHGLFLREVKVSDSDLPGFEELRSGLLAQLTPSTPLQRLAFERLVASSWIYKLALRQQMSGLQAPLEQDGEPASGTLEPTVTGGEISDLWGRDRADLRSRIRVLASIRDDIAENGLTHINQWRGEAVRLFGAGFVDTLTQWQPQVSDSALQLALQLVSHAEKYQMPLPPELEPPKPVDPNANPALQRDMMAKLVELKSQSLRELLDFERTSGGKTSGTAEFAARYAARATRALEAAVHWFVFLRDNDL